MRKLNIPIGTRFGRFLVRGISSSCGCLASELNQRRSRGYKSTAKEYLAWCNMRRRCSDPSVAGYKNYGGRGITVCPQWLGSDGFATFLADMGTAPSPEHSIDRKDNDGNYEPDNCRWATSVEQNNNRRPAQPKRKTK